MFLYSMKLVSNSFLLKSFSFPVKKIQRFFHPSNMLSRKLPLVAVCQMTSISDKEKNFEVAKSLIESAKLRNAEMVFLPECFDFIGESKKQAVELAEPLDGPLMTKYKELASSHSLWLSLGGFHEKGPDSDPNRIYNSHVLINNKGEIESVYHKLHMFDVSVPGSFQMKESDFVIPGDKIAYPIETPIGKIGLGICYDMRFPSFSMSLKLSGAEILTFPSAFMEKTGAAHWETLLRAQAITTQCYIIAAAQVGKHNPKRSSYGHAMVVDPWGNVVAHHSEGTGIICAEIDLEYLKQVRERLPTIDHLRSDVYGHISTPDKLPQDFDKDGPLKFGPITLLPSQIFYRTQLSMAFVNRKPVVNGHVLVSPLRCVEKLWQLSPEEVNDISKCAQKVQKAIERHFDTDSTTLAIQDGPHAGQSVPHLHMHILPRKPGDFKKNDDIYIELENHDKNDTGKMRTDEEMAEEAIALRKYFV